VTQVANQSKRLSDKIGEVEELKLQVKTLQQQLQLGADARSAQERDQLKIKELEEERGRESNNLLLKMNYYYF